MNVFVLEDDPTRVKWFNQQFGGVVHTDDVLVAQKILLEKDFDLILLDHDLGGGPYKRGKNGDGIDLACFLANKSRHIYVPIIIYSLNDVGSANMLQALSHTHNNVYRIDYLTLRRISYDVIVKAFVGD